VTINTGQVVGLSIPGAALSTDEDGNLGIKTVLADNKIGFCPIGGPRGPMGSTGDSMGIDHPIKDGFLVTGCGQEVDLVVRGAGFVRAGQIVDVVQEE